RPVEPADIERAIRLSRRVGVLALGVSMAARPVLRALTGRPRALGRGGG
ncbi:cobalamin biosynthesis protein, partial [Streptomyces sp. NPDC020125]